ncbi:MAG: hypothetical protein KDA61_17245, partial [Planctomycetales bacterium]|nr:hypothetical protein [Planctomycetales bacterium]
MSRYANRFFSRHRRLTLAVALTAVGLGALFAKPLAWARPADPSNTDKRIALLVSALMDRRHLSEMRVGDEISRRALDMFLQSLDPLKLYFLQSDIDQFATEKTRIDDYIR